MVFLIAFATLVATLLGGAFAIKYSDKLHLILGFSAGAVVGVAFFDLLPEAIELTGGATHNHRTIMTILAVGFIVYMILDRVIAAMSDLQIEEGSREGDHHTGHHHTGRLGAVALVVHSFLDGLGIGLAFQVSAAVGAIVAVAVLVHDFSDGINTVNLVLRGNGDKKGAFHWLIADAVAPVIGVLAGAAFALPPEQLGMVLALFAGFFLYIGASDLLPESHHRHPKPWTTVSTVLGMIVIYVAIMLAG